jgi:hypothetical protein
MNHAKNSTKRKSPLDFVWTANPVINPKRATFEMNGPLSEFRFRAKAQPHDVKQISRGSFETAELRLTFIGIRAANDAAITARSFLFVP